MDKLFNNIYDIINQRKAVFLVATIMLFGVLFWTASTINFEEDISKLIPSNSENEKLQEVLNTVKFNNKIIVNITRNKTSELNDLIDFATDFTDSISENFTEYVSDVQGKIESDDALETLDFVYNNLPLFLSDENYKRIDSKLHRDSILAITNANYNTLISPSGIIAKTSIVRDPLGITFMGLEKLKQLGIADSFEIKNDFLISKDQQHILLFLDPEFNSNNANKNNIFSEKLATLQNQLNKKYTNKVSSEYFGGPLIAKANAEQIKTDIQLTSSIALTILLLLFIFFYRKLTLPIILFIPTLFGGLLAISVLSLIRTDISAISLGIGAVLLGVTLDYSLHILTHIRNRENIKSTYKHVTKPILMSSITTALAFLCLLFINSQALQDLGVFAAISVIGASIFSLLFIPQVYKTKVSEIKIKITFIDRIANYDFSKSYILITVVIGMLVVSIFTFGKVNFNQDLSQLNYIPKHLKTAEANLDQLTNVSSKSLYVIAYGEEIEPVLQTNDSIFNTLLSLKEENTILNFNSVGALINSKQTQQNEINDWKQFWNNNKIDTLKNNLINSGLDLGFKPNTFHEFYELLNTDFKPLSVEDFSTLQTIPIHDFISLESNLKTVTSIVKVDQEQISIIKDTFKDHNNIMVIDRQGINESLLGNLKDDFSTLISFSLILIFILLLLFYRNIKLTFVTILPIVLTWFLTLGIMGLFHLEFNIFNIIISTFIFGLGVDYSIFMTNGLQHQTYNLSVLATYKTSVILSVITTVLGIGVLIFAKHPALHSLALVSIIGIASAMFMSFIIQPLLYQFFILKTFKKNHNGEN